MNTQALESDVVTLPPPGVVLQLSPELVERSWSNIEAALRPTEQWSQTFSIANFRSDIAANLTQLWGCMDFSGRRALAVTRLHKSARGLLCTVWVIAPQSDDRTICTLIDNVETFARMHECVALEIIAHPWLSDRVSGKLTAAIIERDLRAPLSRTN